jgi:hypothetical protein
LCLSFTIIQSLFIFISLYRIRHDSDALVFSLVEYSPSDMQALC